MRDQDKVDVWFLRVFAVIDHGPTVRAKVRNDLSAYALHRSAFLFRTRVIGMSTKPTVTFRQLPLSFTRLVRIKHEDNKDYITQFANSRARHHRSRCASHSTIISTASVRIITGGGSFA